VSGERPRPRVTLAPVDAALRPGVLALEPHPGQERFSGAPAETLPAAEADPHRHPVAVLEDGVPVGYFALDAGPDVSLYLSAPGTLGFRGFLIDRRHQGRGLATAALAQLPAYVAEHHPWARRLALTVNVTNPAAIRVYRRAGFEDTGRMYHGGRFGPQHVLVMELP
jgi:RimJ/RimL family protein N-acetyltransferase